MSRNTGRSQERKTARERALTNVEKNSSAVRQSTDSNEIPVTTNDEFAPAGCLKGEECHGTPRAIHRFFEEMLTTNAADATTALIYRGDLRN